MVTDTLRTFGTKPHSFAHKFALLPVVQGLLTGRGKVSVLDEAERQLGNFYLPTLISVAEMLPVVLYDKVVKRDDREAEFFLIGWCDDTSRMRAFSFRTDTLFLRTELEPGAYLNPELKTEGREDHAPRDVAEDKALDTLVRCAKFQHAAFRADVKHDGPSVGGDLICVEMTRKVYRVSTAYRFADYDALAAQMRSPTDG